MTQGGEGLQVAENEPVSLGVTDGPHDHQRVLDEDPGLGSVVLLEATSIDEEMTNLVQYQQGYEASARALTRARARATPRRSSPSRRERSWPAELGTGRR